MKHEANATPAIIKYIKAKGIFGAIEIKQTTTESFLLSNFESHQLSSLDAIFNTGLAYKLSDADPRLKPCDVLSLPPYLPAWVAISFKKSVFFIRHDKIIEEIANGKKSITPQRALEISTHRLDH